VGGGAQLQGAAVADVAGLDEVRRIESRAAVLALVPAGGVAAALGAGTLDVAICQETVLADAVELLGGPLLEPALPVQIREEAWLVSVWIGRLVWEKLSKDIPKRAKESRIDA